jgi:hypothetical protein
MNISEKHIGKILTAIVLGIMVVILTFVLLCNP